MHRLHRRDDRNVRAHEAAERRDLARMIHSDLEHPETRVGRHARQRQWHAPMIVERFLGCMCCPDAVQAPTQSLLGAGLAHAARDSNDARIRTGTRCASDAPQPLKRGSNAQQGAVAGVRHALQVVGRSDCHVTVAQILGMITETNPTIVGAAAIDAVWKALDYLPSPQEVEQVEQITFASSQLAHDALPDFTLSVR